MKDLIVVVADLDIENVLKSVLPRFQTVYGIRPFTFEILRHPYRDAGCATGSAEFLRPFLGKFKYVLVVFDREGCGMESNSWQEVEIIVTTDLLKNGWDGEQIRVIVIDPELENWMWIDSPHVAASLGWKIEVPLYQWLRENGLINEGEVKPGRPKEAMELVLRKTKKPRSASIYAQIAANVSFRGCTAPSFLHMVEAMKGWFGYRS
jgi:hypothetical protein